MKPQTFRYLLTQVSFLGLCMLVINPNGSAQNYQNNLEKYWLYKERLYRTFMVVGAGQGESIPAEAYDDVYNDPGSKFHDIANLKVLAWSDATAHLGYYIAMLATERRILELIHDPTAETDKELYFALNALWRLDATSGYYSYDDGDYNTGGCYMPSPPVIPQMNASNYNDGNQLDGFLIRDDVPTTFNQHWPDIDTIASNLTTPNSHECKPKEMSQDQAFAILFGLLCVKKFVPNSLYYNGVPLQNFAIFEAERILKWCKGNGDWKIRNPHIDGSPIVDNGGASGLGFSTGEVYAGMRICHIDLTNAVSGLQNPFWQIFKFPIYLPGNARYNVEPMIATLAAVGNSWDPCPPLLLPLSQITNNILVTILFNIPNLPLAILQYIICLNSSGPTVADTRAGLDRYAGLAKEAQYLLHHLVYASDWSKSNNISEGRILDMLNIAPCEGPYSFNPGPSIYGWNTPNRFWIPRISADGDNDNLLLGKSGSYGQIYNGIDYMLLHNLYYLWRFHNGHGVPYDFPYENLSHAVINRDWPIPFPVGPLKGSDENPIFIRTIHSITASGKVKAYPNQPSTYSRNGNARYRAGDWIVLADGFEVDYGADFEAYIDPMECVNGKVERRSGGMSPEEFRTKAVYDAANAEVDSLHDILLKSLGMTEDEYAAALEAIDQAIQAFFAETSLEQELPGTPLEFQFSASPTHAIDTVGIYFTLPEPETVSLNFLNMTGKIQEEILPPSPLASGHHAFQVTLRRYPPGFYKVLLKHGDQLETRPVVKLE